MKNCEGFCEPFSIQFASLHIAIEKENVNAVL